MVYQLFELSFWWHPSTGEQVMLNFAHLIVTNCQHAFDELYLFLLGINVIFLNVDFVYTETDFQKLTLEIFTTLLKIKVLRRFFTAMP